MITTNFRGRLGNVLLSVYSCFWYAKNAKVNISEVIFDKKYEIPLFGLFSKETDEVVDYIERNKELFENIKEHFIDSNEYFNRKKDLNLIKLKSLQDLDFKDKDVLLDHYVWHRPSTESERADFRKLFFNEKINASIVSKYKDYFCKDNVALHVRRGDFAVSYNGQYLQSKDRVQSIIDSFYNKTITIFSDDIEYCRLNFISKNNKLFFHPGQDRECLDLILMSNFDTIIPTPGSTFSECALYISKSLSVNNNNYETNC